MRTLFQHLSKWECLHPIPYLWISFEAKCKEFYQKFLLLIFFMLPSEEVIALDKRINMFLRSIRSIVNPQVTPRTIASSTSKWNKRNEKIQAHVTMTKLGHKKQVKKQLFHLKIYQVPSNIIYKCFLWCVFFASCLHEL